MDGACYYFDSECSAVTGLATQKADGKRSYPNPNTGKAVADWKTIGVSVFHSFNDEGRSID